MKKKGGQITINLSNRIVYTLIALTLILIASIGVYAYDSGFAPSEMGHSLDEIKLPSCSTNEFLKFDGSNWVCSSSSTPNLEQVLGEGINAGNNEIVNVNGIRTGSSSSPGSWDGYFGGRVYVSSYLRSDDYIQPGQSSASCSSSRLGAIRVHEQSSLSRMYVCMKTGSNSYDWMQFCYGGYGNPNLGCDQ